MRNSLLALAAASLAISGCTPEPVDIPDDLTGAAPICFLAQAMTLRDERNIQEGDPVSLSLYAATVKYPMIAASKAEDFDPANSIIALIPEDQELIDKIEGQDYEAAVPQCDKLFGIAGDGEPATLPERDSRAAMACYGTVQYMNGVIQAEDINTEGKDEYFAELTQRFEASFDALLAQDPETLAALTTEEDAVKLMNGLLKEAFAQGDPLAYLDACDKRFSGKVVAE